MMSEVEDMLFSEYVTSAATRCSSTNAGSATASAGLPLENMASHGPVADAENRAKIIQGDSADDLDTAAIREERDEH
jgi:hypothetical protein